MGKPNHNNNLSPLSVPLPRYLIAPVRKPPSSPRLSVNTDPVRLEQAAGQQLRQARARVVTVNIPNRQPLTTAGQLGPAGLAKPDDVGRGGRTKPTPPKNPSISQRGRKPTPEFQARTN